MTKLVAKFLKNESGATAIEYGLIAAGIALAIIAAVNGLGTTLNTKFSDIGSSIISSTHDCCIRAPGHRSLLCMGPALPEAQPLPIRHITTKICAIQFGNAREAFCASVKAAFTVRKKS